MPKKSQSKTNLSKKHLKKRFPGISSPASFSIERTYNASQKRVWRALTSNNEIKQWYFDLPDFQPSKGFEFQFLGGKDQNHMYKHLCKITEVIPFEKLAYSWQYEGYDGYSEVSFELFSEGSKTRVKLTHTGINTFPEDNDDLSSKNFAEGWTFTLDNSLKGFVERRKIILFNMITLDGYFEGVNKWELDWHNVDPEFNDFAIKQLISAGGIIFGKNTYEGMANYWSSPEAKKDDPNVAKLMNETPKFVFSKSLQSVSWENTTLLSGDLSKEVSMLKSKVQDDVLVMGSAKLCSHLLQLGLIDELRIMINPILLGAGNLLFSGFKQKLKLISCRKFKSGNVLLYYHL